MNVLDVDQVPERLGHYLAGFTDGEGSFNVSFRKRGDYTMPWKVSLCFNVSQRDKVICFVQATLEVWNTPITGRWRLVLRSQ